MYGVSTLQGVGAVISGPLNSEGKVSGHRSTILEMNETHPARVRCQATCLNQQGTYCPEMALILRGQEQYIPIPGPVYGALRRDSFNYSWDGLHFEIRVAEDKNLTSVYLLL